MVQPRRISDFKPTLSNLAGTSHYQVIFGGLPLPLRQHLNVRGVDYRFIGETAGLLCSNVSLPGSSNATADIDGHFMGVVEKMATARLFTEIQAEFLVDSDYKTVKFFEHWIEYMASGSGEDQAGDGYYIRMMYPEEYKSNQTKIIKFDRDYNAEIEYTFYGLFPKALNDIGVSYDQTDALRLSVTFSIDRYICGRNSSFSLYRGNSGNRRLTNSQVKIPNINGAGGIVRRLF